LTTLRFACFRIRSLHGSELLVIRDSGIFFYSCFGVGFYQNFLSLPIPGIMGSIHSNVTS